MKYRHIYKIEVESDCAGVFSEELLFNELQAKKFKILGHTIKFIEEDKPSRLLNYFQKKFLRKN